SPVRSSTSLHRLSFRTALAVRNLLLLLTNARSQQPAASQVFRCGSGGTEDHVRTQAGFAGRPRESRSGDFSHSGWPDAVERKFTLKTKTRKLTEYRILGPENYFCKARRARFAPMLASGLASKHGRQCPRPAQARSTQARPAH